eukprot:NODE_905_length_3200_cov_0.362786.p1 type:complete len:194 gc:universal NODE_905_length_3200_cov_0.362786:68-649(+)
MSRMFWHLLFLSSAVSCAKTDITYSPTESYILFAHSNNSEQSLWYKEQYWNQFVSNYRGNVNLLLMDEMNSTVLCQFSIKAFPVVRIVFNNTFGRVLELESLHEIVKYKFTEDEMPESLASYFTEYVPGASKICTIQVDFHQYLESKICELEMFYDSFRKSLPYHHIYVIAHDIPIILLTFYYLAKKIVNHFK